MTDKSPTPNDTEQQKSLPLSADGLPAGRVKKLIKHLGGRTNVWRRLNQNGIQVPASTIGSWITRNSIPANRIKALDFVGNQISKPIDWNKVLTK